MYKNVIVIICFLYAVSGLSQTTYTDKDKILFASKLLELTEADLSASMELSKIGKTFQGTPYVEKTLEVGDKENLVINLRGFDCTTFVENTLAFGRLLQLEERNFKAFAKQIQTIRYRNGELEGYSSRLHYFTEWILNNEKKGFVKDITGELGGIPLDKAIDFMGTHRELYPFLEDDTNYAGILEMEAELSKATLCYLPQDQIAENEHLIHSGDIIALTTSIIGLDVTHTGIATREADGRIHLLHASTSGQVVITKQPLVDYLRNIKSNIGIMVARPIF